MTFSRVPRLQSHRTKKHSGPISSIVNKTSTQSGNNATVGDTTQQNSQSVTVKSVVTCNTSNDAKNNNSNIGCTTNTNNNSSDNAMNGSFMNEIAQMCAIIWCYKSKTVTITINAPNTNWYQL